MRRALASLFALVALLALAGCGGSKQQTSGSDNGTPAPASPPAATTPETTAATPAAKLLAKSLYDDGPRAASTPADPAAAARGEKLFSTKGCMVCHAIGQRKTCPDLAVVAQQRTAAWMEQQIMHPDVMTQTDPIAHDLFVTYKLQMTNFHVTEAEAKDVIEFLKSKGGKH